MTTVVFYFQVHQPHRLRPYTVFDTDPNYFDDTLNREILLKVADRCYRPATRLMLELVRRYEGRFRVSFSLTGTVIDQLERWAPDALDLFRRLADSGCAEFLAETYHHSLAFLYSREEFVAQVDMHEQRLRDAFGVTPRVIRNTELTYNNDLAHFVNEMRDGEGKRRYLGVLTEGIDRILNHRTPDRVYRPPNTGPGHDDARPFALLLKNYRLSDDIAFRFGNRSWHQWPLTADTFARWVHRINGDGDVCNLFMDYECLGEHQPADTGIFQFIEHLPRAVLEHAPGENEFATCSEAMRLHDATDTFDAPNMISWADTERDLSAWLGNAMQAEVLRKTYDLEDPIKRGVQNDSDHASRFVGLLDDWRRLTTSDHAYYMCTKYMADGDVHKYFNPYATPYDAYMNFMNVVEDVRTRLDTVSPTA
jgi:alpha-amylase